MDENIDTNQQQNDNMAVWPPAPSVSVEDVSVVSSKKLITKYTGLDITLGAGIGLVLPPFMAMVSSRLDTGPHPLDVFIIAYLASTVCCLYVGLRKRYKIFSTALLIGSILSFVSAVCFVLTANIPGGPD